MTTVLVSGFELFGNTPINPAQGVAEAVDGATIAGANIVGVAAPSRWFDCIDAVTTKIAEVRPSLVIMLGK